MELSFMITLFESIYPDKRPVSSSEIQFMLKLFQQDLKTVLLDISYSVEDRILLLLNGGQLSCIYVVNGDQLTRYSPSNLSELFQGRDRGTMRICDLKPSFFGAVRTMLEQPAPASTTFLTADLSKTIQEWQTSSEPSFVHIRWPNAEGFVFVPGNNFSARQYAFLAEDKISDSAAAVSMFSHWSEPECVVSHYMESDDLAIWRENNLQLGVSLLLEHSLRRYDDLAGHSLSMKLEDSINRLCSSNVWNIVVGNTTVDDVHIFDSGTSAASAYRAIFDLASRQMGQVIGTRLFNETIDEGVAGLSEPLKYSVKNNVLTTQLVHA
jgi:hypothetical protein